MMPPKDLKTGDPARSGVLAGASKLAEMVVVTMGPKGRNVLIERGDRSPIVTKDGVTVAKEIFLSDPFENMGAQIVKDAAARTNDLAGDGTTTATLLAYTIMRDGMKFLGEGLNAISLKRGMDYAVEKICAYLDAMKKPIDNMEECKSIATISAQDVRVGEMLAKVLLKMGDHGVVTVERGNGFGLEEEYVEGMQFDNGYTSPYFVTDPTRMECVLEEVPIIITDERIVNASQMVPLLDKLAKEKIKAVLIIADSVDGDAQATLILNVLRKNFFGVPVKAPAFGPRRMDMLQDIAALTGGRVITEQLSQTVAKAELSDLGRAKRVVITKHMTTIVGGNGKPEEIEKRKGEILAQIALASKDSEKERLQERLAKLSNGVGIIKVGAASDYEQKELQHRVEDALSATRAAMEEGILPGGGVAYVRAKQHIEKTIADELKGDELVGAQIVLNALPSCLKAIADNAGVPGVDILSAVEKLPMHEGYDAATGTYGNMFDMKIINPKKVERCALIEAASVAGMFLTLGAAMVDKVETTPPTA